MTLPLTTILPENYQDFQDHMTRMYEDFANAINGVQKEWTPTLSGGTTAGVGTYDDSLTHGYYYRQGLLTDVWFIVTWSAHTGTGNMYVDLPFKIRRSAENFFVGTLEITGITLTANYEYATLQGNNDTNQASVIENGSAQTLQNVAIVNAAAQMRGHLRYIGQEGA